MHDILVTTSSFAAENFPEGYRIIYNPFKRTLTEKEITDLVIEYDPVAIVAGVEPLTESVMRSAPGLRVISRCGAGVDSVDLAAAKILGITVATTPDAPVASVAELTLGLILCLLRYISQNDANIRKGGWKGSKGNLLSGKTVGIIGCGRIGTYVSKLLKAFDCDILGHDPYISAHGVCDMTGLEKLLQLSDIITLHLPYTKENRHIIGVSQLEIMKPSALLINAARGGLVDEKALYDALKDKKIAGAALDCFQDEPYHGPLLELDNVLLSPHMGSSASEARELMEEEALENLKIALLEI